MTARKRTNLWPVGQSGNPAGRPQGSKHRLAESFIAAPYADWNEHGVAAIEKVRQERPADYLKIIASIIPKELHVKEQSLEDERRGIVRDDRCGPEPHAGET